MCEKLISIQKLIYESFSKRIRKALEEYKDKVITEAEYLAKMRSIMEDYRCRQRSYRSRRDKSVFLRQR